MTKRRSSRSVKDRYSSWLRRSLNRRKKRNSDLDDGGVPVQPNKPDTLSGGAAAELEFDGD